MTMAPCLSAYGLWKNLAICLFLGIVISLTAETGDLPDARGIPDACVAGILLDLARVSNRVVVFHSQQGNEAGCIFRADGSTFLYTSAGSAQINPSEVEQVPLETVTRDDTAQVAGDDRDLSNGCMVYATCSYAQDMRNPDVVWAGIVTARTITVGGGDPISAPGANGHAIAAFEDDQRDIFIQTDSGETRKLDDMSDMAKSGNRSWHDPSVLIYHDHRVQGIAKFEAQYGQPK